MVLQMSDGNLCCSVTQLFAEEGLQQASQRFLSTFPATTESGCRRIEVLQGELARIRLSGPPVALSSDGATTCCIALAVDIETDAAALAHLDGHIDVEPTLSLLIQGMTAPLLHLVGCYKSRHGHQLLHNIFDFFERLSLPKRVTIALAVVGPLNTAPDGSPRCQSLQFHSATITISRSTEAGIVRERCPDWLMRNARFWLPRRWDHPPPEIYDPGKSLLIVNPLDLRQRASAF